MIFSSVSSFAAITMPPKTAIGTTAATINPAVRRTRNDRPKPSPGAGAGVEAGAEGEGKGDGVGEGDGVGASAAVAPPCGAGSVVAASGRGSAGVSAIRAGLGRAARDKPIPHAPYGQEVDRPVRGDFDLLA